MRLRWILSSIGFLMILSSLVFAQEAPKQCSFELKWQEHGISDSIRVPLDLEEPFEKEPDFGGREVLRGILRYNDQATGGDAVGILLDKSQRTLYVDLNRDGDLTNDPNGMMGTPQDHGENYNFETFYLNIPTSKGVFRYQLRSYFWENNWQNEMTFYIQSGYGGVIILDGIEWHLGVNDCLQGSINRGSRMTIQPTFQPGTGMKPEGYSENFISSLNVPKQLFFGGHCYEVEFEFRKGDSEYPVLWCTLTEKDVPQAMLRIEAGSVEQLVFGDDEMLILPPLTEGAVSVPAGDFYVKACNLKYEKDRPAVSPTDIESIAVEVADGRENVFKIGTPLQNSVRVERTGKVLKFHYELHGAGGETYSAREISNYDSSKKPTLAIYKGDMKLASGSFEYG